MTTTTPKPQDQCERRFVPAGRSALRSKNGVATHNKTIVGYAAIFNVLSEDMGGFREEIAPGAFTETLRRGDDVRALIEHQGGLLTLGRTSAGSLRLQEDPAGLQAEIDIPPTSAGLDLHILIERGALNQMSFAFRVRKQQWSRIRGQDVRTLIAVDLFEVSVVAMPAYEDATIALRALTQWRNGNGRHTSNELDFQRRRLAAYSVTPL